MGTLPSSLFTIECGMRKPVGTHEGHPYSRWIGLVQN